MCELIKILPEALQWGLGLVLVLVPIISLVIAAIALMKNLNQTKLNNRIRKATVVSNWIETFLKDEKMQMAFYRVEYDKFKYTDEFHGSDEELGIDRLLRHFSSIALLWENGLLGSPDIESIKYFLKRVVENPEITNYCSFVDSWSKKSGAGSHPYSSLHKLCEEL